ncbi:MAG: cohesin domain-containing protein [Bacteroidota bacterium]
MCISWCGILGTLHAQRAQIKFNPNPAWVSLNDVFMVDIIIETSSGQFIDGGEIHLNFDPAVLEIQGATGGTSLPIVLIPPTFDNTLGTFDYAAGTFFGFPTGIFTLVSIQFRAIGGSTGSLLTFEFTPPTRLTSVTSSGTTILDTFEIGTVVVDIPTVRISPRIILSANKDSLGTIMRHDLRSAGLIPPTEPYSSLGFTQVGGGGETVANAVLNVTGNNAVVDWVKVELRPESDSSAITVTQSALLQRDGDIVSVDGISPLTFEGITPGKYFVVIMHRNHLPVMTQTPLNIDATTTLVDFRSPGLNIFGAVDYRASVNSSFLLGVPGGDVEGNGDIVGEDRRRTWNDRSQEGYFTSDINMDGRVSAADRILTWNNRDQVSFIP